MSAQIGTPVYRHRSKPGRADDFHRSEADMSQTRSVASSSRLTAARQPKGIVSPSRSSTSLALRSSTTSPTPSAETFDAFVQAADPRHPQHTAWLERYSSFSPPPSRQSSTQTRTSMDHRRRNPTSNQQRVTDDIGSDADDMLNEQETYFRHGSTRSHNTSSTASMQQRQRARVNRDKTRPKPLQPPTPPPRTSSSMNRPMGYGPICIPEIHEVGAPPSYGHSSPGATKANHVVSTNETAMAQEQPPTSMISASGRYASKLPLSSLSSSRDNMGAVTHADEKGFFKLPRAFFGRRARSTENDQALPSPSSTQSFASQRVAYDQTTTLPRKSFSRMRQVFRVDSTKTLPAKEEAGKDAASQYRQTRQQRQDLPVMNTHGSSKSIPRVPPPTMSQLESAPNEQGVDADQTLDLEAFPLRLDDEFREEVNEFEMSDDHDDDGMEREEIRLPWVSTSFTPHMPLATRSSTRNTTIRSPGLVRRSLDSIVSPFRAGVLAQSISQSRNQRQDGNATPLETPGRRSMSESRLLRPFVSRQRHGSHADPGRPLSIVADQPDAEKVDSHISSSVFPGQEEVSHTDSLMSMIAKSPNRIPAAQALSKRANSATAEVGRTSFSWKRSQRASTDITRPLSTLRGLQTSFARSSTQVNHSGASTEPTPPLSDRMDTQSRRTLSGFLSKVRGSVSSRSSAPPGSDATDQSNTNSLNVAQASSAARRGRVSLDAAPRSRSRSFASRGRELFSTRLDTQDSDKTIPEYPTSTSADRLSESDEPWRRQLLTSAVSMSLKDIPLATAAADRAAPTSPEADEISGARRGSLSLGRLWQRKSTREDTVAALHSASLDIAAPRSSMSLARDLDVVDTNEVSPPAGPLRLTIRRTLSPAIVSEQPRSVSEAPTFSTMHRSQSAPFAISHDQEELEEVAEREDHSFRSPLGRFIHGATDNDRLSRVEEVGERQTAPTSHPMRASASLSPVASRVDAHSMRRSVSGNLGRHATSTGQGETEMFSRLSSYSMNMNTLQPSAKVAPSSVSALDTSAEGSPGTDAQPFRSSSATSNGYLAPASTATRSGRSSFSQDRDRTPVASPISVPLANNRGALGQAMHILRGKGKSKGVGPSDVLVVQLAEDKEGRQDLVMDAVRRPSVGTPASLAVSNGFSKRLNGDISARPKSPTSAPVQTGSYGKEAAPAHDQSIGLGLAPLDVHEGVVVAHGGEGSLMTSTTSEGTFSTLGAQTPESHSTGVQVAHTPVHASQQPDLRAFDAMLGNFPQQEKVLLRDISARALEQRTTPIASNSRSDDDLSGISARLPAQDHRLLHVHLDQTHGTLASSSVVSLD